MKISIKPVLFLLSAIGLLLAGCASSGPTTPEANAAADALKQFHRAEITGDVDGMVAAFSDNWTNPEGATKAVLRGYFEGAVAQGAFLNLSVNEDDAGYSFDGSIVTATPIVYNSPAGPSHFTYKLKKETDGVWRIVNSYQIQ
ncbi:MAG TPA: hypothetical protein EYQ14_07025 [Gammaproteobacteria bacterium]|nr:hypothetical protein [Gammaproteobacteria bacterium]HIL96129.1 hypothetical protein [Pseudomonadales bacterium]